MEICSLRLVLEGKTGKTGEEIPKSSRLELSEKFLAHNFALADAEDNPSGPLNGEGIADLPLLRTLLAICKKSREPSFCEAIDSYSSIWKSGSFKNPFATITSLSKLYFRFRRFILLVQTKTSDFYKLWQQHKQPKNMEISEVWLISIPTRTHLQNSLAAAEALTLKISSHGTSLKWSRKPSQSLCE